MTVNEKLLERISNIQNELKNIQNIDLDNIADLKKAKEAIRVIKNDFEKMLKESPLYAKVMDLITKWIDYDVIKDIEQWENLISEKLESLKDKAANIVKKECDCTCNDDQCECENWGNIEDCDDEVPEITLDDDPLTGEEILDDYLDENFAEELNLDNKETYANLIAEYLNKNHEYLDRVEDDEHIDYLIHMLFDFVDFTMNR